MQNESFTFDISLSVLNHLGRNLYRSFITVLGEAISNSWDADAHNVRIYIDKEKNSFYIKDDGVGMDASEFQKRFLNIGYSKRITGSKSPEKRPYIGRKGIGKLALLSCAEKISIITKKKNGEYVGGVINNPDLDQAITDNLRAEQYSLGDWNPDSFSHLIADHGSGTIIYFENLKEGIKNNIEFLQKVVALYFRFSLVDNAFKIFINDELITAEHLGDLIRKTEFLWNINDISDPFVELLSEAVRENPKFKNGDGIRTVDMSSTVSGFIASVKKPKDLAIITTDERVGVDLYVNGRLRERDILKHINTDRIVESYLYGQVHFNALDDEKDRFTSSREGVVADDPLYEGFLGELRPLILQIAKDWDDWRLRYGKDGNPEDTRISRRNRKSQELFNAVADEYTLPETVPPAKRELVDSWVDALRADAQYNVGTYTECFLSENLVRNLITTKAIPLGVDEQKVVTKWKSVETESKRRGGLRINIRKNPTDTSYLDMGLLADLADKPINGDLLAGALPANARQYKAIRDALAHTALLTEEAQRKMTTVYDDVRARIKQLLS